MYLVVTLVFMRALAGRLGVWLAGTGPVPSAVACSGSQGVDDQPSRVGGPLDPRRMAGAVEDDPAGVREGCEQRVARRPGTRIIGPEKRRHGAGDSVSGLVHFFGRAVSPQLTVRSLVDARARRPRVLQG